MKLVIKITLSLLLLGGVSQAQTQTSETSMSTKPLILQHGNVPAGDTQFSAIVGVGPTDGAGIGGKFSYRFLPNGILGMLNNSLSLEAGLFRGKYVKHRLFFENIEYYRDYFITGARWDFHLAPKWSAFFLPEVAYYVTSNKKAEGNDFSARPNVGGFFHLNKMISFRAEGSLTTQKLLGGATVRF